VTPAGPTSSKIVAANDAPNWTDAIAARTSASGGTRLKA
jgi:hypothetical protein